MKTYLLFVPIILVLLMSGCTQPSPSPGTSLNDLMTQECVAILNQEGSSPQKDICYSNAAQVNKDVTLCEKISGEVSRNGCFSKVAPIVKDESICEKITTVSTRDSCYLFVASRLRDSSICEKASDVAWSTSGATGKDTCLSQVIRITGNSDNCAGIQRAEWKDYCYRDSALIKSDTSICQHVVDNVTKERCNSLANPYYKYGEELYQSRAELWGWED
jgi:hypothetical protein